MYPAGAAALCITRLHTPVSTRLYPPLLYASPTYYAHPTHLPLTAFLLSVHKDLLTDEAALTFGEALKAFGGRNEVKAAAASGQGEEMKSEPVAVTPILPPILPPTGAPAQDDEEKTGWLANLKGKAKKGVKAGKAKLIDLKDKGKAKVHEMTKPEMRQQTCPQGHALGRHVRVGGMLEGSCDGCGRNLSRGSKAMDCRRCNYDLCDRCDPRALETADDSVDDSLSEDDGADEFLFECDGCDRGIRAGEVRHECIECPDAFCYCSGCSQRSHAHALVPNSAVERGINSHAKYMVKTCPRDHALTLYMLRGGGTCDGCGRRLTKGSKMTDCRRCNYGLCDQCDKRALRPGPFSGWKEATKWFKMNAKAAENAREYPVDLFDELTKVGPCGVVCDSGCFLVRVVWWYWCFYWCRG